MKYNFDEIFEKLDVVYDSVENEDIRDLISEIINDVDDALYSLQYDMEKLDKENELLHEKMVEMKGYRF